MNDSYTREQILGGDAKKFCDQAGCAIQPLEKGTQFANRAECFVKIFKDAVITDMREPDCPLVLWCYALQRRSEIINATAADNPVLEGTNPYTRMTGQSCDISNLCQFKWYEWVYYRDEKARFPYQKSNLGRCLGPAKSHGNAMSQWVLNINGKVQCVSTLRKLTRAEIDSETEVEKRIEFIRCIRLR